MKIHSENFFFFWLLFSKWSNATPIIQFQFRFKRLQWPLSRYQHRLEVLQLECRFLQVSEMGVTIFKRWDCHLKRFPSLPFHTPRSSQESRPYLSSTHWLWQLSPMMNLRHPRRFRDSWCTEPVENTIKRIEGSKTICLYSVLFNTTFNYFSCLIGWNLTAQKDQTRDFGCMG